MQSLPVTSDLANKVRWPNKKNKKKKRKISITTAFVFELKH